MWASRNVYAECRNMAHIPVLGVVACPLSADSCCRLTGERVADCGQSSRPAQNPPVSSCESTWVSGIPGTGYAPASLNNELHCNSSNEAPPWSQGTNPQPHKGTPAAAQLISHCHLAADAGATGVHPQRQLLARSGCCWEESVMMLQV